MVYEDLKRGPAYTNPGPCAKQQMGGGGGGA